MEARVGPYRILRKIREGGQGRVYLGYDSRLQRKVAIKIYILPPDRGGRRSLLREARMVSAITHPRVVQVHDVITSSGHLALVMEYVPGTDLEQFLQVAKPSIASVLSVSADLAGALAAARQQRIVHGDLKPSNVLIAPSGRAKLSDFGIARAQNAEQQGAAFSHAAVSPEQLLGEKLDNRSDLFSLGCLIYRMIAGHHPFYRRGRLDREMLLEELPPPLEERPGERQLLPDGLADMVMGLLEKDPRDRPANTHQVREVLRRVAREVPLSAGNPLQLEAAPWFRPEAAEELPLPVPEELGLEGRSRLHKRPRRPSWTWRDPADRPRFVLAATAICAVVLLAVMLVDQSGWTRPVRVHIDAPELAIANDAALPADLSIDWLVGELKDTLQSYLGPMLVTGPVGATPLTTLYTRGRSPAQEPPLERYSIGLRCTEQFCLLGLSRERSGLQFTGGAMLFPDRPRGEWRLAIERAVQQLFQQSGRALGPR